MEFAFWLEGFLCEPSFCLQLIDVWSRKPAHLAVKQNTSSQALEVSGVLAQQPSLVSGTTPLHNTGAHFRALKLEECCLVGAGQVMAARWFSSCQSLMIQHLLMELEGWSLRLSHHHWLTVM